MQNSECPIFVSEYTSRDNEVTASSVPSRRNNNNNQNPMTQNGRHDDSITPLTQETKTGKQKLFQTLLPWLQPITLFSL